MKTQLLVASTNREKLKELKALLADVPVELVTFSDFPNLKSIEEDGSTFRANAEKKAIGFARQAHCLTLADDSGLVVDYLNGAPGIHSARYAGQKKNDLNNCQKLVKALEGVSDPNRSAAFQCAVALATPEKVIATVEERVSGKILEMMKGTGGFGYDPLFFYPDFGKTFAEIPASEKHRVSHRGKALHKMKVILEAYLKTGV